jgi:hypothetical protein
LDKVISDGGTSVPLTQKLNYEVEIPKNYPLKKGDVRFAVSPCPVYGQPIKNALHPRSESTYGEEDDLALVDTRLINTPIPRDFSGDSLSLLDRIQNLESDEILKSKVITKILDRKWALYGKKFFLIQLILYASLMLSLILIFNFRFEDQLTVPALMLTGLFLLYEFFQLCVQKLDYFKDIINWVDLLRFGLIIYCIAQIQLNGTVESIDIYAIMFGLLWFKLIKYLQVFDAPRYLTRIMFDCVADLGPFLLILVLVILAYA